MEKRFRPMLGATLKDPSELRWPLYASYKLDGIRAIWQDGCFWSRAMKPIPNIALSREMTKVGAPNGLDGELICGKPTDKYCFNTTTSAVMTRHAGAIGITFHVFDNVLSPKGFEERIDTLPQPNGFIKVVEHVLVRGVEQMLAYEDKALRVGYEGLILRDPLAPYKQGRSTIREQGMIKVKRFADAEGMVVGFEELMHNANEAKTNELGYTSRTSHKANQVPTGRLGSLMVKWKGITFGIGTGFTDAQRQEIWDNKKGYVGMLAKFKYLPIGLLEAPRHPVFLGWVLDRSK